MGVMTNNISRWGNGDSPEPKTITHTLETKISIGMPLDKGAAKKAAEKPKKSKTKETKMTKDTNPGGLNRHKAMAMGKDVAAMKKGGAVKGDKAADKPVKPKPKAPAKKTVKK